MAENAAELAGPQRFLYFCLRRLNPFMKRLLRSRFHHLVSGNILLITFAGRSSGRLYTTPVSYIREGETITVATPRACRWWANLRGDAVVTLLVAGRALSGNATVITDDQAEKAARIRRFLQLVPRDARYYRVALDASGMPDPADLERAAQEHIIILVRLHAQPARLPGHPPPDDQALLRPAEVPK
jgi:hypothetical protein